MPQTRNPQPHRSHRPAANVQRANCVPRPENKSRMKLLALSTLAATLLAPQLLRAQASDIPNRPHPPASPPSSAVASCSTR